MKLLLAGDAGAGSLLQSLSSGLRTSDGLTIVDTSPPASSAVGLPSRLLRRARLSRAGDRLVEATQQLTPDVVLLIKGRGVSPEAITRVQQVGASVACYYPDNPLWSRQQEPDVLQRLSACNLTIAFSQRQAAWLQQHGTRTEVLPFGYDDRWFAATTPSPSRRDVVFLGTWSRRRQRYLAALRDLPLRLVVRGTGWDCQTVIPAGPPVYEREAGRLLAHALVGINLLHPQCALAHNMRTREITACGALQLTDPGLDGTQLRDEDSCLWFVEPQHLREQVLRAAENPEWAAAIATRGQVATASDTYVRRGAELRRMLEASL